MRPAVGKDIVWGGGGGECQGYQQDSGPPPAQSASASSPCPQTDSHVLLRPASGPGCEEGTFLGGVSAFPWHSRKGSFML